MDGLCQLVASEYGGSLKAEHGTGRNVAPFVELEWGSDAYRIMERVKQLFDHDNVLSPGVVLNSDPLVHIKNLKPMPVAHKTVDNCIECGFCERACPSRELSLTPRQRIVSWREISRLRQITTKTAEEFALLQQLEESFEYNGEATCAADGMCSTRCPVSSMCFGCLHGGSRRGGDADSDGVRSSKSSKSSKIIIKCSQYRYLNQIIPRLKDGSTARTAAIGALGGQQFQQHLMGLALGSVGRSVCCRFAGRFIGCREDFMDAGRSHRKRQAALASEMDQFHAGWRSAVPSAELSNARQGDCVLSQLQQSHLWSRGRPTHGTAPTNACSDAKGRLPSDLTTERALDVLRFGIRESWIPEAGVGKGTRATRCVACHIEQRPTADRLRHEPMLPVLGTGAAHKHQHHRQATQDP
jgi:NAD-dependent dihydropyrimidine dehydrogenase PreA subunit